MPRVLLLQSSSQDLTINLPYTLIVRRHGFIFKKMDLDEENNSINYTFMLKINPKQIKKLEIRSNKNEEYFLYFECEQEVDSTKHKFNFSLNSLELPVSVLYDKLMKIIDPEYEEKSIIADFDNKEFITDKENSKRNIQNSIDEFLKKSQQFLLTPIKKGFELVSSGLKGIQNSVTSSISKEPKKDLKLLDMGHITSKLNNEIELDEILLYLNKIHINHVDSAYSITNKENNAIVDDKGKFSINLNIKSDEKELKKPIIIFLPPFGADLWIWKKYFNYFQNDFRIISYDHRGYGGSEQDKNDNYKFSEYIKDFNEFLRHKKLDINNKDLDLIIITSSFTGLMLLHNLNNLEIPISSNNKFIFLNSVDKIDQNLQNVIKKLPHPRTWGILKKSGKGKAKEILFSKKTSEETKNVIISNLYQSDNRVMYETLKNLTSNQFIEGIKKNNIIKLKNNNVLFINGKDDILLKTEFILQLNKSIDNSNLVLIEGNHFVSFENPSLVIMEIVKWL